MCDCILALPNELKKVYINEFCRNIFEMYAWIFFVSLLKYTVDVEVSNKLTFVIKKIPND